MDNPDFKTIVLTTTRNRSGHGFPRLTAEQVDEVTRDVTAIWRGVRWRDGRAEIVDFLSARIRDLEVANLRDAF